MQYLFFTKRRGAALLGVVLVSLIVLGIFAAVAFNIAMNTMRVERWQREHFEEQQMHYLARSAVLAVGAELSNDVLPSYTAAIDRTGSLNVSDSDRGMAASLDFAVSADKDSNIVLIQVTAYNPSSALSNDTKAVVKGMYSKSLGKVTAWNEGSGK